MPIDNYSIGGTEVKLDASEAIAEIPQNRVLLTEKLTDATPIRPEVIEGLTNIEQVFEHFRPQVNMEFETEEGSTRKELLQFSNLGDFGVQGITAQSAFLRDLTMKKDQYQKMIKQLKTNKQLKLALSGSDTKAALVTALQALARELEEAK